ncbi:MAG: NADH-quinone oxidoreductase subunit J [Myxococcaceae bacterium]|nr:NADH-quinone oxidoreductase subunit J [Myxococcaceae bacterium]
MSVPDVLFYIFAVCLVGAAGMVVASRNPINAAMSLVAAFFFLAGIYVLLWAHTIAVLQVLVYAGAVMVLFLFVIMLLSLSERGPRSPITVGRILGGAAALGLGVVICIVVLKLDGSAATLTGAQAMRFGTIARMGELIYGTYLFPFEAVSLLLLAAIVGAVVVAKSRI